MEQIRLDKYLSVACGISRTDAKKAIRSGKVLVDSKPAKTPEMKLSTEDSEVLYDGKRVEYKKYIYILMNKPSGILSASSDKRVKTVIDLIPNELKRDGLFPVGRLDKTTTGLLIITNDGNFAHRVISPKSQVEKCYYVQLDGALSETAKQQIEQGAVLADGAKCLPSKIELISERCLYITICEGKYHQIKRMFGTVDLGVNKLHRVSIGRLVLPQTLEEGKCVEIGQKELNLIKC